MDISCFLLIQTTCQIIGLKDNPSYPFVFIWILKIDDGEVTKGGEN